MRAKWARSCFLIIFCTNFAALPPAVEAFIAWNALPVVGAARTKAAGTYLSSTVNKASIAQSPSAQMQPGSGAALGEVVPPIPKSYKALWASRTGESFRHAAEVREVNPLFLPLDSLGPRSLPGMSLTVGTSTFLYSSKYYEFVLQPKKCVYK
jgi:hypothetical protein